MQQLDSFTPDVVILGGGDYPAHTAALTLLRQAPKVVCCDGATLHFIEHEGRLPWRIVGDGDSLTEEFVMQHAALVRIVREQDDNDQTKAVRYCLEHGLKRIAIVGATGGREDHAIGNISLLMDYMRQGLEVRMYTNHGCFIPCQGSESFHVELPAGYQRPHYDATGGVSLSSESPDRIKGPQVSIFNFGATSLRSTGLKYPIHDFSSWWQGTLNEAIDSEFTIHAQGCYLVFLAF